MVHVEFQGQGVDVPVSLYERACKFVGLDDSRIAVFEDATALKKYCDKRHPASNPDAKPNQPDLPSPPPKVAETVPDKIEFDSKLEAKFIMQDRLSFDEENLKAKLREVNRRFGKTIEPVKVVKTVTFDQQPGKTKQGLAAKFLVTQFVVYYK
jgi:hypothetical protein